MQVSAQIETTRPLWLQRTQLFVAAGEAPWMQTHAALPTVEVLQPDRLYRVYFSPRDERKCARIAAVEMRVAGEGFEVDIPMAQPVVDLGSRGTFDDSGVTCASLVTAGTVRYLYYTGWSLGVTVPFYYAIGLAISHDGGPFRKLSAAPIMERNAADPYMCASPCVLLDNGVWRMWYVSCTGWKQVDGQPRHYYHIRYAESSDGIAWRHDGHVCIDYGSADEYAFGRPVVVKDEQLYRMWFCVRGEHYRLGYAESSDGLQWNRNDAAAAFAAESQGWDAGMQAYPWVFRCARRWVMLYNGNDYGRTGFGYAVSS